MADLEKIKLSDTSSQWASNLNTNFTNLDEDKVSKALKTGSESEYKVLSDNNFSDADKTKLANIADNAQVNVIEKIKKNGTELSVVDKAVDISVPTKTSDLTNDGDGTSNFATESYVDTNGGKIDKIQVNGKDQTITAKTVNITTASLELKDSDLTNDRYVRYDSKAQGLTNEQQENARINIDAEKAFTKNTAFNKNFETQAANIKMNGTASIGTLDTVARADHIHPSDTTKLDVSKANVAVAKTVEVVTPTKGDNVAVKVTYRNISNESETEDSQAIPLATTDIAGLMASADYAQFKQNTADIARLKNTNVRLLYSTKADPSADEIDAFVQSKGYTSPYQGISVVIEETKHVWHYYEGGTGWKDDGSETVSNFTNTTAGVILGSDTDGKVYAESDGTGSVKGWDSLKNTVSNLGTTKLDKTAVKDATGDSTTDPISQKAATDAINAAQTGLNEHIADKNNPHSVTAEQIGLGNVNNTSDLEKPISTATQTALDAKQNKNLGTENANKNVVTDAEGNITTEDKAVIKNIENITFTDTDSRWGDAVSGIYTLTLASAKTPISNARKFVSGTKYQDVMCTVQYDGTNIYILSDAKFSGQISVYSI